MSYYKSRAGASVELQVTPLAVAALPPALKITGGGHRRYRIKHHRNLGFSNFQAFDDHKKR